MKNIEPTEEDIQKFLSDNPQESWYTAREKLRDEAYSTDHQKPSHMDWGTYWKTY